MFSHVWGSRLSVDITGGNSCVYLPEFGTQRARNPALLTDNSSEIPKAPADPRSRWPPYFIHSLKRGLKDWNEPIRKSNGHAKGGLPRAILHGGKCKAQLHTVRDERASAPPAEASNPYVWVPRSTYARRGRWPRTPHSFDCTIDQQLPRDQRTSLFWWLN